MTKNNQGIIISEKPGLKGEDGYKTFSVRIKEDTVRRLDKLRRKQTGPAMSL